MASSTPPRKRVLRSRTIEINPDRLQDANKSKKSRLSSTHSKPSSSQPQSSTAPSMLLPSPSLPFNPTQLVDDGRSEVGCFVSYNSSFLTPISDRFKLSNFHSRDMREFFEMCLGKLQHNDQTLLLLEIDFHQFQQIQSTRLTDALAINSTLLELRIKFHPFTDVIATQLVDALKVNSTLTRLDLKENRIDDVAATQLSELLRFNTTLLSLDLSNTEIPENAITALSAALIANTNLTHLNLRSNRITQAGNHPIKRSTESQFHSHHP